jgi:predicted RNase H-like nuclease (RuvC/YqgF family)
MIELIQENIGGALGTAIAAIIAMAITFKKMKPGFALDEKVVAAAAADNGIIERLERESKRLSDQNDKLANNLNAFQLQIVTFQTENQKLSFENNALKEENMSLREEIMELRREVQELGKELLRIQRDMPNCQLCPHKPR